MIKGRFQIDAQGKGVASIAAKEVSQGRKPEEWPEDILLCLARAEIGVHMWRPYSTTLTNFS
jgi:hypothetical protein